jgi:hypothetical protein
MKINLKQLIIASTFCFSSYAQVSIDTLKITKTKELKFNSKQLIIPAFFLAYGVFGLESGQIKGFNSGIREEVKEHIDEKFTIDDFSQYLPIASLYGLSALGIKGKNSSKDKTIILATSYLLMGLTVNTFKKTARVERPDGTSFNSFPSGHTATAFMGAELMYQEYKHISVWYGISGYAIAAGTGAFRMYNNRHWLSDVLAGAGIGILSAKAGYWLQPITTNWFRKKKSKTSKTAMIPFYDGQNATLSYIKSF